jgi:hypothetical protein
MIGQNRSPEAQYNLALQLPIERLVAIMQGQPGPVDQSFALMALKQKRQEKTAAQGLQAQQSLQQPTVAQQVVAGLPESTGVGALAAPNMGGFADGGIIGMAGGGDPLDQPRSAVGDFFSGIPYTFGLAGAAEREEAARQMREHLGKYGPEFERKRQLALQASEMQPGVFERLTTTERLNREAAARALAAQVQSSQGYMGQSPWEAAALAEKATPARAIPTRPAPAPARVRSSAAAPAAAGIAQLPVMGSEEAGYPGMNTGEAPALLAAAAPAEAPRRSSEGLESIGSFQKALEQISGATKPYTDRMTEVFKQMTPTAEEKEAREQKHKGLAALLASSELLKKGTNAAEARGAALKQIANLEEAYGKETREDKKAMLGAEINMLGALAQHTQGNTKVALDMKQHADRLAFDGIRERANEFFKEQEIRLKKEGLTQEAAIARARDLTQRYVVDEQAKWHKYSTDVLAGTRGVRGAITEKDKASFTQRATQQATKDLDNPALAIEYKKKYPNESKTQHITRRTQELFNSFMQQQPSAGIPSLQFGRSAIPEDADIL